MVQLRNFFVLFFVIISGTVYAELDVDSLKTALRSSKEDTMRCYILNQLANLTDDTEWPKFNEQLFQLTNKLIKATPSNNSNFKIYRRYLAEAINNKGFIELYKGKSKSALDYFFQSLEIHRSVGNSGGESVVFNNIGAIYENQGNIPKALEFYYKSLAIKEKRNDKDGIAGSLNNIGLIYSNLGDDENALISFRRCLKFEQELKQKSGTARVYYNMGHIYTRQKKYAVAQNYINKSLNLFRELNDKVGIAYNLSNLGETYEIQGKLDLAYENYEESLRLRRELDDKKGMATCLYYLSKLNYKKGNYTEAKKNAVESYKFAEELGYPDLLKNSSERLYFVYKREGDYRNALNFMELFKKMNDSIYNVESKNQSTKNQLNYQFQRKEDILKQDQEKQELNFKNQAKNQRIILVFSLLILVFTLIFLYVLYRRFKVSQKQRRIISMKESETQRQKALVEQKNHEILDSIQYARRIQSAILPSREFIEDLLPESFVMYQPKDIVAGDFYWFDKIDNLLFFACADCTGHGVPGALVSVVCHNALNRTIREFQLRDSGEILDKTREIVVGELNKSDKNVRDGMDISLGVINLETQKMLWSGANNPIWIVRQGKMLEWKPNKQPIGSYYNMEKFTTHEIQMEADDVIYCFSDGYQDQFGGENGKKYKVTRLRELVLNLHTLSMRDQHAQLVQNLFDWMGDTEQVDDICLIGFKC